MSERHACPHCDKVFEWGEDADSDLVADRSCRANAHWKLTAHMSGEHADKLIVCPRSGESPMFRGSPTYWRADRTCSYCGSISPEALFAAIDAGCQLGPTDKNYKVYVDLPNPDTGKMGIIGSANHQVGEGWFLLTAEKAEELALGSYDRQHNVGSWVKLSPEPASLHAKFYFQHLDADGQQRFIDLLNAGKLNIGMPGHFYRLPFFCARRETA